MSAPALISLASSAVDAGIALSRLILEMMVSDQPDLLGEFDERVDEWREPAARSVLQAWEAER